MATKRQFNLEGVVHDAKETINKAKESQKTEKHEKEVAREYKNPQGAGMKKNIRNAFVSDESLFRLDLVRKQMNSNRSDGDEHISLAVLMGKIIEEYLDKNYPETKELYGKIYGR